MIQRYTFARVLLLIFCLTGASCKQDFLEVIPKGKVIAVSVRDYELLLNNPDLQNVGADAQILMGDEVVSENPYYSGLTLREQRLFTWSDAIYQPDEDSPEITGPLASIYTYNKIINEVMDAPDGTVEQKRAILAEALAGRAWTYFLLINYFGKPYDQATAASDPGFPIITRADITNTDFQRASVQQVYDLIIADLKEALLALPEQVSHRLRMSKPAAQALLGKVYLFMHRDEEALPLLEAALEGFATAQIPVQLYDYNETFAEGGLFMPIGRFGPNYPLTSDDQEVAYLRQFSNFHGMFNTLQVAGETMDLYAPSDLRLFLYSNMPFPTGTPFQAGAHRRTAPNIVPFGVGVPDTYLLLAECLVRTNQLDAAGDLLEQFRAHRMPPEEAGVPSQVSTSQQEMLQFVIQERLREFAGLGSRWFDMRRLYGDPLFSGSFNAHTVYEADGTSTEYTLRPERLTLRIPPNILQANPGMQNNP